MEIQVNHRPGPIRITVEGPEDSPEMPRVLALLEGLSERMWLLDERRNPVSVSPGEVVWADMVEDKLFVYTTEGIYQATCPLSELELRWERCGLFRCSKSTVVNLYAVQRLRSLSGNRIEALLQTGEKVVISRRYAPILREKLQGRS